MNEGHPEGAAPMSDVADEARTLLAIIHGQLTSTAVVATKPLPARVPTSA
jgi:hypothetical protein